MAHQLEVSVRDIEQFKRQNDLVSDEEAADGPTAAGYEEIDLRAEDDALIAAELEAAEAEAEAEAERARAEAELREEEVEPDEEDEEDEDEEEGSRAPRARRRGRRGGRRRSAARNTRPLEGTFDHGEEGYGLWLDPAIQENPIYAEHWAGHRPVEVTIEEDRIVIRRAGEDE